MLKILGNIQSIKSEKDRIEIGGNNNKFYNKDELDNKDKFGGNEVGDNCNNVILEMESS